ncbi:hypothetical protein QC763_302500 [Podospora pseudopauciseta]|uniref:C2H2-type domain-containing protein n=1 Tax=Podospora pseudopauciseta TaxID=2093780 RepID=A0ABR0HF45_9PEZI|nr:hypothetical protein QC763_302500 [Podospora pseudopauciseta]
MAAAAGAPMPPPPPGPFNWDNPDLVAYYSDEGDDNDQEVYGSDWIGEDGDGEGNDGQGDSGEGGNSDGGNEDAAGDQGNNTAQNDGATDDEFQRPVPLDWNTYDSEDDEWAQQFKCIICPRDKLPFARSNNLRKHQQNIHLRPKQRTSQFWAQRKAKLVVLEQSSPALAAPLKEQRTRRRRQKLAQREQNHQNSVAPAPNQARFAPVKRSSRLANPKLSQHQRNAGQRPIVPANISQRVQTHARPGPMTLLMRQHVGMQQTAQLENIPQANAVQPGNLGTGSITQGHPTPSVPISRYPAVPLDHNQVQAGAGIIVPNYLASGNAGISSQPPILRSHGQTGNRHHTPHRSGPAQSIQRTEDVLLSEQNLAAVRNGHLQQRQYGRRSVDYGYSQGNVSGQNTGYLHGPNTGYVQNTGYFHDNAYVHNTGYVPNSGYVPSHRYGRRASYDLDNIYDLNYAHGEGTGYARNIGYNQGNGYRLGNSYSLENSYGLSNSRRTGNGYGQRGAYGLGQDQGQSARHTQVPQPGQRQTLGYELTIDPRLLKESSQATQHGPSNQNGGDTAND